MALHGMPRAHLALGGQAEALLGAGVSLHLRHGKGLVKQTYGVWPRALRRRRRPRQTAGRLRRRGAALLLLPLGAGLALAAAAALLGGIVVGRRGAVGALVTRWRK